MSLPWTATGRRGFADIAVPWLVGLFYAAVALGEPTDAAAYFSQPALRLRR
jgi:hypothetical protein